MARINRIHFLFDFHFVYIIQIFACEPAIRKVVDEEDPAREPGAAGGRPDSGHDPHRRVENGDRIREEAMCAAMGVSRTPLREALRILSSEGLIESIPNRGSYVAQPSVDDVGEMFFVMSVLEGTCARLCAEKLDAKGLGRLDSLFRKLEQHCRLKDREKYMAVNHSFHSLVQALAGNRTLSQVIDGLRRKILLHRYRQIYRPGRLTASMQEHRRLQRAFRDRDPDAAEASMRTHLRRQFEALRSVLTEAPGSRDAGRRPRGRAPARKEVPDRNG
jgi:DNA-binding GntR family transcriptional regulator